METQQRCQVCPGIETNGKGCTGKYRCPRCGLRYGRVTCFQQHEATGCERSRSGTGTEHTSCQSELSRGTALRTGGSSCSSSDERLALVAINEATTPESLDAAELSVLNGLRASISHQKERICYIVDRGVDRATQLERLSMSLAASAEFAAFAEKLLQFICFRSRYDEEANSR
ncbi:hypothetical protein CCYA_CCYA18G4497 [Cyanidiococcus yangmingshanensis]|nr:hypothetical protein CCYA_CCYA18G4497 [Cyanidiococcus yangmingshanensis]